MAIATFSSRVFDNMHDLVNFVRNDPGVVTIIEIVTDNSGKYILFYKS